MNTQPLLRLEGISKSFRVGRNSVFRRRAKLQALIEVDLRLGEGETLGIVGESGCGKSTLARIMVGLARPDGGAIEFAGQDLSSARSRSPVVTRGMQMVFQDPYSALNPRMSVGDALCEPLTVHQIVAADLVEHERDRLLEMVGLTPKLAERLPHELSGGQRQRINIARALSVRPKMIVADEAVASLDVSVRAQILNLFSDLREELGLTLVFISHDLSVIDHLCDRVSVMYLGRVVEEGPSSILIEGAKHHYTRGLASAIPQPIPGRQRSQPAISGELPSPINPPSGCVFRTRCPAQQPKCAQITPQLDSVTMSHRVACHFPAPQGEAASPPSTPPSTFHELTDRR